MEEKILLTALMFAALFYFVTTCYDELGFFVQSVVNIGLFLSLAVMFVFAIITIWV